MAEYTLKEIQSQPKVWKSLLDKSSDIERQFESIREECSQSDLIFIGCGTSYYLALSAASVYAKYTTKNVKAVAASDVFIYPDIIFNNKRDMYKSVLISRSGMTTEVIRAAKDIKTKLHKSTCAISCRPGSELVNTCDHAFIIPEADEKSVVMTRSFTSMLLLIQIIASIHSENKAFRDELSELPKAGKRIINDYQHMSEKIFYENRFSKFVYLGQGPFYGLACESMLKIKEMSLSSSEAYHSLEFRHGPMAMADEDMLLTFFISDHGKKEDIALLREMKTLGVKTLVICEKSDEAIDLAADYLVEMNSGISDFARMVLTMPVPQLLGYYCAKSKGLDPDNPKNLTQVVEI